MQADPVEKAMSGIATISDSLSTQAKRKLTIPETQWVRSPLIESLSTSWSCARKRFSKLRMWRQSRSRRLATRACRFAHPGDLVCRQSAGAQAAFVSAAVDLR